VLVGQLVMMMMLVVQLVLMMMMMPFGQLVHMFLQVLVVLVFRVV
jgi:hypothetical protein